jgi:hypothetical protein
VTLRKAVPGAIAVGILAALGLRFLGGVFAPWAVLLALPITAVTLLGLLPPRGAEPVWAPLPEPEGSVTAHQASALASRLVEAVDNPARYPIRVQPRLRVLALARLRRAGIEELADPRAALVLGPRLHRLVTDQNAKLPEDPRTAAALFAELEE